MMDLGWVRRMSCDGFGVVCVIDGFGVCQEDVV